MRLLFLDRFGELKVAVLGKHFAIERRAVGLLDINWDDPTAVELGLYHKYRNEMKLEQMEMPVSPVGVVYILISSRSTDKSEVYIGGSIIDGIVRINDQLTKDMKTGAQQVKDPVVFLRIGFLETSEQVAHYEAGTYDNFKVVDNIRCALMNSHRPDPIGNSRKPSFGKAVQKLLKRPGVDHQVEYTLKKHSNSSLYSCSIYLTDKVNYGYNRSVKIQVRSDVSQVLVYFTRNEDVGASYPKWFMTVVKKKGAHRREEEMDETRSKALEYYHSELNSDGDLNERVEKKLQAFWKKVYAVPKSRLSGFRRQNEGLQVSPEKGNLYIGVHDE